MIDTKQVARDIADAALAAISIEQIEDELISVYGLDTHEAEILAFRVAEHLDGICVEIEEN